MINSLTHLGGKPFLLCICAAQQHSIQTTPTIAIHKLENSANQGDDLVIGKLAETDHLI